MDVYKIQHLFWTLPYDFFSYFIIISNIKFYRVSLWVENNHLKKMYPVKMSYSTEND